MRANSRRLIRKVHGVEFHRNGVAGEGFHAVSFTTVDGMACTAVVFAAARVVAVLSVDQPLGYKWRGDLFEPELRAAIAAYETERTERYRERLAATAPADELPF